MLNCFGFFFILLLSSSWLFSHAAALSDWRHRLGDESSQLQCYKSQPVLMWFWLGPWDLLFFQQIGSTKQFNLSFTSSPRGCVHVLCISVCVSGRVNAALWWKDRAVSQGGLCSLFLLNHPLSPCVAEVYIHLDSTDITANPMFHLLNFDDSCRYKLIIN